MSTGAGTDSGVRGPEPAGDAADPVEAAPPAAGWRELAAGAFRFCLLAFVGLRLAMLVVGVVSVALFPAAPVGVSGWRAGPVDLGWQHAFAAWERFDALWFLRIADGGYRFEDGSAFFPVPARDPRRVVRARRRAARRGDPRVERGLPRRPVRDVCAHDRRALRAHGPHHRGAALRVPGVALLPHAVQRVAVPAARGHGLLGREARSMGERRRLGALAALTRSLGVALAPALVVEALHQRAEQGARVWPGVAAAAATGLGLVAYLAYWAVRAGDWFAPITRQANWERTLSFPLVTLWNGTVDAFRYLDDPNGGYWLLDWVIVVPMLAASVYAVVRLRPSYGVYLWAGLLLPLTFAFEGRPLMSMPRFLLPLFPAFWGLALELERLRVPRAVAYVAGAVGLGILCLLTVNWYYIF